MSSSVFSDLCAHVHTCTQICSYNTHTQVWMESFGDIIFYTWLCSPKKAGRSPRVLKVREQHASKIRERERGWPGRQRVILHVPIPLQPGMQPLVSHCPSLSFAAVRGGKVHKNSAAAASRFQQRQVNTDERPLCA